MGISSAGLSKLGTMDMTTAEVNMEVAFGHSRFVPFLGGGVGAMRLDPTLHVEGANGSLSADTKFVGDFGVGFKLFFSRSSPRGSTGAATA